MHKRQGISFNFTLYLIMRIIILILLSFFTLIGANMNKFTSKLRLIYFDMPGRVMIFLEVVGKI